ncbi:MAG: DUF456 domain-containing protein [Bacteroidales bacterium]|nr:DUF456 domain-containing protein [Bacteroidales bacterium]MBR6931326.1 DUF456 domain-containing protein [Bacteroidales bacterium]
MMYVLIVAAILLSLIGIVGAVVPGIAGTPFSFLALLAMSFVDGIDYSARFLLIMGLIGALVFAMDYVVPIWGTKKFGGTKAGVRGSTIGLFLGLFITFVFPIGFIAVLLGPFIGAYIGEKSVGTADHLAWRSALGSFIGFLLGTGIKIVYAFVCIYFIIKDLICLI